MIKLIFPAISLLLVIASFIYIFTHKTHSQFSHIIIYPALVLCIVNLWLLNRKK